MTTEATSLDEKALESARAAKNAMYPLDGTEAAIRAYLAALGTQPVPAVAGDMVKALKFYADKKNWMAGRWPDDPDELVEDLICIDWQHEEGGSIPFADCGDRARKALAPAAQAVAGDTERLVRASQWLQKRWRQKDPNTAHIRQLADYEAFLTGAEKRDGN